MVNGFFNYMKFNGHIYDRFSVVTSKKEAESMANKLRKTGFYSRILRKRIRTRDGSYFAYGVYSRRRV